MGEPVLVGLLFADRVITENNGKKSVIGTFNRFLAPNFPMIFPPWFIYAAITNLDGKHEFSLSLGEDDSERLLFSLGGGLDCPDSGNVIELEAALANIAFPGPGKYVLTFQIDNFPIGSRILTVDKANPQPAGNK
jgi:hypothetical protein